MNSEDYYTEDFYTEDYYTEDYYTEDFYTEDYAKSKDQEKNDVNYVCSEGNIGIPKYMELANAYVPSQQMSNIYDPESSLCSGTVFPELSMPYKKWGKNRG